MGAGGFFAEPGKRFLKLEAGSAVLCKNYSPDSLLDKGVQGEYNRCKHDS